MSDVDTLGEYGHELLTACAEALATTTAGAPAYQSFSPGLPAFDCPEGLWVHVAGLGEENTQPGTPAPVTGLRTRFGQLILATLIVTITRCAPTGDPIPSADAIAAVADQTSQDVWAIWNHLYALIRDGSIFGGKCSLDHFDGAAPLAISGESAGWTFQLRPQIDGYRPAVSS
jgi:hypothetical protein